MAITNREDIPLVLAVWALVDDYDYVNDPNYISVTSLLKPTRQIVLGSRVTAQDAQVSEDVDDYVSRALGSTIHAGIEKAWSDGRYIKPLLKLGYPESAIARIKVNPKDEELEEDTVAIYIEQRETREIGGFVIGGKYDVVAEGMVQDNKTTSAYTWVYGGRDIEHQLQGSCYKWLDEGRLEKGLPRRISEEIIRINYVFTDWQKSQARINAAYPQSRTKKKDIALLTERETEDWILNKLSQISNNWNQPEEEIPECDREDLWMPEPQFKYYADPSKTSGRSTRNFDSLSEANTYMAEKGKGIVITVQGEPKRCGFCPAFNICTQKDRYFS